MEDDYGGDGFGSDPDEGAPGAGAARSGLWGRGAAPAEEVPTKWGVPICVVVMLVNRSISGGEADLALWAGRPRGALTQR